MTQTEALKLALSVLKAKDTCGSSIREAKERAIAAAEEALTQPEHSATHGEPVAVVDLRNVNYVRWLDGAVFFEGTKLYTTPYVATPRPQRPSRSDIKPLTDEQIWEAYMKAPVDIDCHVCDLHKFARAIEAAHNIKG